MLHFPTSCSGFFFSLLLLNLVACADQEDAPPTSQSDSCPPESEYDQASFEGAGPSLSLTVSPVALDGSTDLLPAVSHEVRRSTERSFRQELVVLFVGTGARPDDAIRFLEVAADLGYHAISLAYSNVPSVSASCHGLDPDCTGQVLEEKIYGLDSSD